MKEFKTINDIHMIQCGEYNWRILKENDGTDIYQLVISKSEEQHRRGHDDSLNILTESDKQLK
jgi:hypothetical protein